PGLRHARAPLSLSPLAQGRDAGLTCDATNNAPNINAARQDDQEHAFRATVMIAAAADVLSTLREAVGVRRSAVERVSRKRNPPPQIGLHSFLPRSYRVRKVELAFF